jgi:hypothetical protein
MPAQGNERDNNCMVQAKPFPAGNGFFYSKRYLYVAQNVFLELGCLDESHWKYYVILDTGCWMFPDLTPRCIPGYPVSSIQHRHGIPTLLFLPRMKR